MIPIQRKKINRTMGVEEKRGRERKVKRERNRKEREKERERQQRGNGCEGVPQWKIHEGEGGKEQRCRDSCQLGHQLSVRSEASHSFCLFSLSFAAIVSSDECD